MDSNILSLHWVFTHQVIPELFHKTPDTFLRLLEKDGNQFLHFYWDEAAKKNNFVKQTIAGLNYELRKPNDITYISLITLPLPSNPGESYYAACIFRPYRVMMFGFISDVSKVLLLDKAGLSGSAKMVEVTPKIERLDLRPLQEITRQKFLDEVYRELELEMPGKTPG